MKFSHDEINNIIGLKGNDGKQIDIFHLHGILFIGNSEGGTHDMSKTYTKFSEHSLGICIKDFEECQTKDEVSEQFSAELERIVNSKLI